MTRKKYYTVWKGRLPGVYDTWEACEAQVKGFPDAEYKAFESREAAEVALRGRYAEHIGKPASQGQWLFAPHPPIVPSLSVDAACSGAPGVLEYRGALTETGAQVFHAGPFADGTNNVGEFLAIVRGIEWLVAHNRNWPIYSDSANAIAWVKAGRCKTNLERRPSNQQLFERIARAEETLKSIKPFTVYKWDTEAWGEIPADFGRK